jgi:hypothetical protein
MVDVSRSKQHVRAAKGLKNILCCGWKPEACLVRHAWWCLIWTVVKFKGSRSASGGSCLQ